MKLIKKYLEHIQNTEAVGGFAMDSVHTGRPLPKWVYSQRYKKPEYVEEDSEGYKKTLLIDFDKTIHKYSDGWKDGSVYDGPIDKSKEAIDFLRNKYEIVIFTTRASKEANQDVDDQIQDVKNWLNKYGIYFDRITAEKIPCFRMIDDLAITFTNWNEVLSKIEEAERFE